MLVVHLLAAVCGRGVIAIQFVHKKMCTWLSDLTSAVKIPNVIKAERQIAHCDDRSADEV